MAREFSEDKARQGKFSSNDIKSGLTDSAGGSLGWKGKDALLPEFSKVAFELETSTTNSPKWGEAKTSEGYHIIVRQVDFG